jgi:hypothetical protein
MRVASSCGYANNEIVGCSESSETLGATPNGLFLIFSKDRQILAPTMYFKRVGAATTLVVPAASTDTSQPGARTEEEG